MKFCVDCKHHKYENENICKVTTNESSFDPVTGMRFPSINEKCIIQRKAGRPCGPSGDLFEPKEPIESKSSWQTIKTFFRKEIH